MTKKILSALDCGVSKALVNPDAMMVITKLHQHGFDGYIVGGGIRDLLIKKTPKDFDIVTNATPEMVRKIFRRNSMIIGRRFKIVHVMFEHFNLDKIINGRPAMERHVIEVSTYRSAEIHGHSLSEHGKIMVDNNYGTQEEDSTRRDFTANALYYDPIAEQIIDYHDGMLDVRSRVMRVIGVPLVRYQEDPVRMLRAIRLAAKLGMKLEADTEDGIHAMKHLLANEHKWRLYEEMLKILLSGSSKDCILWMKKIKIPKQVFLLFDKLFFGAKQDQLALKVLEKTDARIREGNDISIVFILAGLLWNNVNLIWKRLAAKRGNDSRQALTDAIVKSKAFATEVGIVRQMYLNVSDVWMAQYDFDNPKPSRVSKMLHSRRFRQGLHLYTLRHEFGQVDDTHYAWWQDFAVVEDYEIELAFVAKLEHEISKLAGAKNPNKK